MKKRLPKRLHFKHGAYYYVARSGGKVRWLRLSAEYGEALRKWAELEGGKDMGTWTVAQAVGHYLQVSANRLKPATLAGYAENSKKLLPVFGDMPVDTVKKAHVYSYVVKRGNVAGNRERALLSAVYAHLEKAGIFDGVNPAAGLQFRNAEKPRQRYVTDKELTTLITTAKPRLKLLLRFAYITGMRQADVLTLKLTAAREEGIWYIDQKTQGEHLIDWTDELRGIWREAAGMRIGAQPVFLAKGGGAYTSSGFRSTFGTLRDKAGLPDITFHDLRRKAGSDADDDQHAQNLLGHADSKVTRRHYRAKLTAVKPIKGV